VEHEVAAAKEEKQAQALKETESEPRVGVPGPVRSHEGAGEASTQNGILTPPADTCTVPAAPPPPSNALIQEIKKELKRVGCYFGPVDDNWRSSDLKRSLQNFVTFAKVANMPDQPTLDAFASIRGKSAAFVRHRRIPRASSLGPARLLDSPVQEPPGLGGQSLRSRTEMRNIERFDRERPHRWMSAARRLQQ
jgi:hypothetical protein